MEALRVENIQAAYKKEVLRGVSLSHRRWGAACDHWTKRIRQVDFAESRIRLFETFDRQRMA